MPKLTEHQDRYDAAERRFLEREYKILQERILYAHSSMSERFKVGGFAMFSEHAKKKNHLLGQRIDFDAIDFSAISESGLDVEQIQFRTLPLKFRIPGTRKWRTEENREGISGFGVSLNLLGWSWFFNKRLSTDELRKRLDAGDTIEDVFGEKIHEVGKGTTKFLVLDGETLSTKDALEKSFIFPQAYYRALRSVCKAMNREEPPDDVRQAVFDDMRKRAVKRKMSNDGLRNFGGKWWIQLSNEDKSTLEKILLREKQSAQEWLHSVIEYQ